MAKNTADGFASNRRSPTLLRRKREMELRALRDGDEFGNLAGGSGSVNLRRSSYPSARSVLCLHHYVIFYFLIFCFPCVYWFYFIFMFYFIFIFIFIFIMKQAADSLVSLDREYLYLFDYMDISCFHWLLCSLWCSKFTIGHVRVVLAFCPLLPCKSPYSDVVCVSQTLTFLPLSFSLLEQYPCVAPLFLPALIVSFLGHQTQINLDLRKSPFKERCDIIFFT